MRKRTGAACLLLAGLLLAAPGLARATVADDLCAPTADPCVIGSGSHPIDNLSVLDFGSRQVILDGDLDVGSGYMQLWAGQLTVNSGGQLRAEGTLLTDGGSIDLNLIGDLVIPFTTSRAFILDGASGGTLEITSDTGNIQCARKATLNKKTSGSAGIGGDGGEVILTADVGDISWTSLLDAHGGSAGFGGMVDVTAGGNVTFGDLDLSGGDADGGIFTALLTGTGSFTLSGSVNLSGGNSFGAGGEFSVDSEGPITLTDPVGSFTSFKANGASTLDGGDGGGLFLDSFGHDIVIEKPIIANASGFGCGGSLNVFGREVQITQRIEVQGLGSQSCGSADFMIDAEGILDVAEIKGSVGNGGGALMFINGDRAVHLNGPVDLRGSGTLGSGGELIVDSGGPITVSGDIDTRGSLGGGLSGDLTVRGCTVTVASGVTLDADRVAGTITIRDGDQMDLSGATLQASNDPNQPGVITLAYRNAGQPPDLAGTIFTGPAPSIGVDPTVQNCDLDADGALNVDDNCPYTANPDQADSGGIGFFAIPPFVPGDGIGDVCQCGDVDGNGAVNSNDLADIREGLADPAKFILLPGMCNVIGLADTTPDPVLPVTLDCQMNDAVLITRALIDPARQDPQDLERCAAALP